MENLRIRIVKLFRKIETSVINHVIKTIIVALCGYLLIKIQFIYGLFREWIGQENITVNVDAIVKLFVVFIVIVVILIIGIIKKRNCIPRFKWDKITAKDQHNLTLKANHKVIYTETLVEIPIHDNINKIKGWFEWEGAAIESIVLTSEKANLCIDYEINGQKFDKCENNKLIITQQVTKANYLVEYSDYLNKYEEKKAIICVTMDNKEDKMKPELYFNVTRPIKLLELVLEVENNIAIKDVKKQVKVNYGENSKPHIDRPLKNINFKTKDGLEVKEYIFRIKYPKLFCTYKIVWNYINCQQNSVVFEYSNQSENNDRDLSVQ